MDMRWIDDRFSISGIKKCKLVRTKSMRVQHLNKSTHFLWCSKLRYLFKMNSLLINNILCNKIRTILNHLILGYVRCMSFSNLEMNRNHIKAIDVSRELKTTPTTTPYLRKQIAHRLTTWRQSEKKKVWFLTRNKQQKELWLIKLFNEWLAFS